ncbi:hypothetical protein [Streptomyces pristinaespiralis]|uniref:hypothetical protein n=1 Tax=Streptomyces pristinaespiralis TaxID=38300 RepID=UPI003837EF23
MRTRFKVQAGLALVLSAFQLSASALTLLPGAPVLDTGLVTGIGFALLFPLFIATIAQGIAVTADLKAGAGQGWVQWLALRCLPRAVQACVACLFAAGIALLVIGGEGPRQSGPVRDGRYTPWTRRRRTGERSKSAGRSMRSWSGPISVSCSRSRDCWPPVRVR